MQLQLEAADERNNPNVGEEIGGGSEEKGEDCKWFSCSTCGMSSL